MLCATFNFLTFMIGLYYIMKRCHKLLKILISFASPIINKHRLQKKFGKDSYVLITGSTAGIGKAYSDFFAKNGFNLILWSRSQEKLKNQKASLLALFPKINIVILCSDFINCTEIGYFKKQFDKLSELDVSIVVNNVGYLTIDQSLDKIDPIKLVQSINVNMIPQATITAHFLNTFEKRSKDVSSSFIDLSSLLARLPLSKFSIYGASKNFNSYFTRSINLFYPKKFNLFCQSVLPGSVRTQMTKKVKAFTNENDPLLQGPEKTVNGSIRGIGFQMNKVEGAFLHSIVW